jgi:putative transposase
MNTSKCHRFPPDIISYAVWLCYRFNLSHRDVEDLLAERGITVSRESIRLWCINFAAIYSRRLKRKPRGYGNTFYIDPVFIKINGEPRKIVTDKLRSYGVAHSELIPVTIRSTKQYEKNRAEQSHEATRVREMRKFKPVRQTQRFLGTHTAVSNLFNLGRHRVRAEHYRNLRVSAFNEWSSAIA